MKRIDELTGLRCIAVGMVVIAHSASSMPKPLSRLVPKDFGDIGVQIFFVLSGFLITSLLKREYEKDGTVNFWAFYRRRLLRITPAFQVFLIVIAALSGLKLIDVDWQQIVLSGTYIWNYAHMFRLDGSFAVHPQGIWYVGHTWSLSLEEQFYWFWPAVFLFTSLRNFKKFLPITILIVPIISMVSYVVEPSVRDQIHMMFHTGIGTILVGCFVAIHLDALTEKLKPQLSNALLLWVSTIAVVVALPDIQAYFRGLWIITYGSTVGASLVAFMILSIMNQPEHLFCRLLRTRVFMFGGLISYSLYLWQQLFTNISMPVHLEFPVNLVASVAAASISYYVVERPFLQIKDRELERPVVESNIASTSAEVVADTN
jgi:peptidoglycan/LPS O-acetylase OafA/YrhL